MRPTVAVRLHLAVTSGSYCPGSSRYDASEQRHGLLAAPLTRRK